MLFVCVVSGSLSSSQASLHISQCPALSTGPEPSASSIVKALAMAWQSGLSEAAHSSLIQQSVRSCQSACRYANAARLGLDKDPANTLSLLITRPHSERTLPLSASLLPLSEEVFLQPLANSSLETKWNRWNLFFNWGPTLSEIVLFEGRTHSSWFPRVRKHLFGANNAWNTSFVFSVLKLIYCEQLLQILWLSEGARDCEVVFIVWSPRLGQMNG